MDAIWYREDSSWTMLVFILTKTALSWPVSLASCWKTGAICRQGPQPSE